MQGHPVAIFHLRLCLYLQTVPWSQQKGLAYDKMVGVKMKEFIRTKQVTWPNIKAGKKENMNSQYLVVTSGFAASARRNSRFATVALHI